MSFYTTHALTWDPPGHAEEDVTEALAAIMKTTSEETARIALNGESDKWYDSNENVAALSKLWPETLFSLDCCGEDAQKYVVFFRNGRHLTRDYVKPEFDEADFEAHAKAP